MKLGLENSSFLRATRLFELAWHGGHVPDLAQHSPEFLIFGDVGKSQAPYPDFTSRAVIWVVLQIRLSNNCQTKYHVTCDSGFRYVAETSRVIRFAACQSAAAAYQCSLVRETSVQADGSIRLSEQTVIWCARIILGWEMHEMAYVDCTQGERTARPCYLVDTSSSPSVCASKCQIPIRSRPT